MTSRHYGGSSELTPSEDQSPNGYGLAGLRMLFTDYGCVCLRTEHLPLKADREAKNTLRSANAQAHCSLFATKEKNRE